MRAQQDDTESKSVGYVAELEATVEDYCCPSLCWCAPPLKIIFYCSQLAVGEEPDAGALEDVLKSLLDEEKASDTPPFVYELDVQTVPDEVC